MINPPPDLLQEMVNLDGRDMRDPGGRFLGRRNRALNAGCGEILEVDSWSIWNKRRYSKVILMLIQMLILIDAYPDADPEHFLVQNLVSRIFAELIAASLKKKKHAKGRSVALFRRVGPASGNHFSGEWEQASALAPASASTHPQLIHPQIMSKHCLNLV